MVSTAHHWRNFALTCINSPHLVITNSDGSGTTIVYQAKGRIAWSVLAGSVVSFSRVLAREVQT